MRNLVRWSMVCLLAVPLAGATTYLRLIEAIKKQDTAAIRTPLKERIDENPRESDGATALH